MSTTAMTGWTEFNVNEIDLTPKPVQPGTYKLRLLGAFDSKYRPGQTDVVFQIAGDTTEAGKKVRLEIPDIAEQPWAGEVYAKLVRALGTEPEPYTHPKDALMKAAGAGSGQIEAKIYTETYTKKDGTEGWRDKIAARSIRATV